LSSSANPGFRPLSSSERPKTRTRRLHHP
jgi:hypothetical protein